jgi:hypothetical protein
MTQPAELPPPVDPGNPYVLTMELPATMSAVQVHGSNGARLLVTIRSGGATLTVPLSKEDAQTWGAHLTEAASHMSSLIVAAPGLPPAALSGRNGHRPGAP